MRYKSMGKRLSTRAAGAGTLAMAIAVLAPGSGARVPLHAPAERHAPTELVIVRVVDPMPRAQLLLDVIAAPYTLETRHELIVEGLQAIHERALTAAPSPLAQPQAAGALVVLD